MLSIKKGVKLTGIKPEIVLAAYIMDQVYSQYGIPDCVITSGLDGTHMKHSKHYTGEAFDFGVKQTPTTYYADNLLYKIVDAVQMRLGENYDVIFETNHIHCEYDPKT